MKDSENLHDIVLVDEVHREREPPRENAASFHEDLRVSQRSFRGLFYRSVQLEQKLDT